MKIELEPGEKITVTFADTDGEITVSYGGHEWAKDALTVHADMPDTSGRAGEIYREEFGVSVEKGIPIFDAETGREITE